jgi:hypothetical protein
MLVNVAVIDNVFDVVWFSISYLTSNDGFSNYLSFQSRIQILNPSAECWRKLTCALFLLTTSKILTTCFHFICRSSVASRFWIHQQRVGGSGRAHFFSLPTHSFANFEFISRVLVEPRVNFLLMNSKFAKEWVGKEKKCARPLPPTRCWWIQNLDATLERQIKWKHVVRIFEVVRRKSAHVNFRQHSADGFKIWMRLWNDK